MTNYTAWRVSYNGTAIVSGKGDERKVILNYPFDIVAVNETQFNTWMDKAEQICQLYNSLIQENK